MILPPQPRVIDLWNGIRKINKTQEFSIKRVLGFIIIPTKINFKTSYIINPKIKNSTTAIAALSRA